MGEQKDRMLRGEPYIWDDDPQLMADMIRCDELLARYNATVTSQMPLRREILAELLGDIGEDAAIRPPLHMDYGSQTTIGARTFINFGCVILDGAPVTIGADVQIAPNVQLLTATHPVEPGARRERFETAKPITIEDNVWLGAGVIVLAGITIGRDSVVGAGAIVTRDIPPLSLAVGNPARVIRSLA